MGLGTGSVNKCLSIADLNSILHARLISSTIKKVRKKEDEFPRFDIN
jgi:hypothetical protein